MEKQIMECARGSFASRYSVAFILCLICLMGLTASVISVSPTSSSGTEPLASSARVEAAAMATPGKAIAQPLASPLSPQVINTPVTATKSHTPSGNRMPGDILTYTVVITNTGANAATTVNFTDTIDPNTTLVPGSLLVSPIAVNDPGYHTIGNVPFTANAAQGVIGNDFNPGG